MVVLDVIDKVLLHLGDGLKEEMGMESAITFGIELNISLIQGRASGMNSIKVLLSWVVDIFSRDSLGRLTL